MSTSVLVDHVAAYADQVRAHLADLGPEQVEDLTDGLEADLAEALEDAGVPSSGPVPDSDGTTSIIDLDARFGLPRDYAAELRAAAGLPLEAAVGRRRLPDRLRARRERLRARLETVDARITASARWSAVRSFLVALRPLWWVARGWAVFVVLAAPVGGYGPGLRPSGFLGWLVLLALVVVSVQYGRGLWRPRGRLAWTGPAVSVVAAVLLVPLAASAANGVGETVVYGGESVVYMDPEPVADGVYLDGERVENLFVYGADGEFIPSAQIIDERGHPIRFEQGYDSWLGEASIFYAPARDAAGREVWNVFPMSTWSSDDGEWVFDETRYEDVWEPRADVLPTTPEPPLRMLPALEGVVDEESEAAPNDAPSDDASDDASDEAPADAPSDDEASADEDTDESSPATR